MAGYEPYQVSQLVKLAVQIETLAAYGKDCVMFAILLFKRLITFLGNNLLVGTRQGHLLMYRVVSNDNKNDVELMRYNKSFSKKAIQQLEVIPEHQILISLTDNIIQVHDINAINMTVIHQAIRTKGATLFTLDIQVNNSSFVLLHFVLL